MQADLAYAAERITHDYPQATGANNTSTVSDYFRNIRAHSIHPRVSVGYDFGGWRIAADYARYRKWNNNKYSVNTKNVQKNDNGNRQDLKTENQENGTFHAVSSLGLSAIYDFKLNDIFDKFKPYIGVRVAYGHVRHSIDSTKKTTNVVTVAGAATQHLRFIMHQRRKTPITKATASAAWVLVSSPVSVSTSRPS
ncbi:opacity porin family protein [Neisseria meningitidis 9506]|nr:opacity porin family protein [Neisseria meningitidis 9506]